ncbi:flagellar hook-length control protein FliK [Limnobacter parvus]|uniref:Flagellar hook-length control protein FliK n=1 Tax=Limnobacter parvus TaxID=2939690 RepID=A0ABT1XEX8_9BURK|nr:flagellar hook-length control protein FliK [Limnobacter parvus]MCR2745456.1 flagellar hook-length control protein FliK [Limnobacter parvus]
MSTSTQAMNNINKVQTQSTGGKPKQANEQVELNFNDLFSSAMGKMTPNSQLNSIESQLRESLFKQDKPKKSSDSNVNTEAAQAAMWAQRNWMQPASATPMQADVSQAPVASSNKANSAEKAPEPTSQAARPNDNSTTEQTAVEGKPSAEQVKTANTENTGSEGASLTTAAATSATSATTSPAATLAAGNAAAVVETQGDALKTVAVDSSTKLVNTEQTVQTTVNTSPAQDKTSTGNTKLDALLSSGNVSTKAEVQAQTGTSANNVGNTNPVAAQLAPQIAQQAQNLGGKLEAEELKVGQKILANGSLQTAGTTNGIAAGTNGLAGTTGTAPQALIKTPVNQPGFAKELGQTVNWAIGKNMSTVDIRVNPETFGPMNMRLVQKGQQVQLVIRTQDEASANLLTQALGGLKEVLAQNGLQLNQVQIQHGNSPGSNANGQNSNAQSQFDQGNGQNRGGQQSANGGSSEQESIAANTATGSARKADGKLDLFA